MHDTTLYFDLSQPECCYILGYFWADCFFKQNKSGRFEFSFEIKSEDFLTIWPILKRVGFKKYNTRTRKNSLKPQSCIRAARKNDMKFFKNFGFDNKPNDCPIFFALEEKMKPYFIKGFLDGDGSVSLDKNNLFRIGFNGPKDQNWSFLENYCNNLNIPFVIYRKDRLAPHASHRKPVHSYSVFEFTKKQNRLNFCASLPTVGLARKLDIYHKYLKACQEKKKDLTAKSSFEIKMIAPGIRQTKFGKFQTFSMINKCGIQKYLGIFETLAEGIKAQEVFHKSLK